MFALFQYDWHVDVEPLSGPPSSGADRFYAAGCLVDICVVQLQVQMWMQQVQMWMQLQRWSIHAHSLLPTVGSASHGADVVASASALSAAKEQLGLTLTEPCHLQPSWHYAMPIIGCHHCAAEVSGKLEAQALEGALAHCLGTMKIYASNC